MSTMSSQDAIHRYVTDLFAPEDQALRHIAASPDANGMPAIAIEPFEGRLLQLLMYALNARQVVEIGTLAGYSATWMARALPEGGKLYTLEADSKHAGVARKNFELAGVAERIELIEGNAKQSLSQLAGRGPFDFVFIDADKEGYPDYLVWAAEHLRPGGMLAAHNATGSGADTILDHPERQTAIAIRAFNLQLADHRDLHSGIIPAGRGLAIGIKRMT